MLKDTTKRREGICDLVVARAGVIPGLHTPMRHGNFLILGRGIDRRVSSLKEDSSFARMRGLVKFDMPPRGRRRTDTRQ